MEYSDPPWYSSHEDTYTFAIHSLPNCVVKEIIDLLVDEDQPSSEHLPRLAAVSPALQNLVEHRTFRTLRLDVHRVLDADVILSRFSRYRCVRDISFTAMLPTYSPKQCAKFEFDGEYTRNSSIFSRDIAIFFDFLSQWPSKDMNTSLSLKISARSPTDEFEYASPPARECDIRRKRKCFPFIVMGDIGKWRHLYTPLELGKTVKLPPIELPITSLSLEGKREHRFMSAETLERITSSSNLSALRVVSWCFQDCFKFNPGIRRAMRQRLADAIDSLPSLEQFSLHCEHYPPRDHSYDPPIMHDESTKSDPVSCALRRASQRTEHLEVHGVLGSTELFWPKGEQSATTDLTKSSLTTLNVEYHIVTPDGRWLFDGGDSNAQDSRHDMFDFRPPQSADVEEDRFPNLYRYVPNKELMDELHLAVGRAASNMPNLESMRVATICDKIWEFRAMFRHSFSLKVTGEAVEVCWDCWPAYRPGWAVIRAWEEMAKKRRLRINFNMLSEPIEACKPSTIPVKLAQPTFDVW
ncbi:hypothetical protein GGR54DRAFT_654020 [Hypoxylon sp. NC1633]|nr:hypothetical protein GGR54DRAFT_654020 [Hypoxylon sp. NC1633]